MENFNQYLKTQDQAAMLVKAGMRIALVQSLTGLPWRNLKGMWGATHGAEKPTPRKTPTNTISYIKRGQSEVGLSTVVSAFFNLKNEHHSTTEAFINAWLTAQIFDEKNQIDINAAWFAIRDSEAGLISLCTCKECHAGYISDAAETRKQSECPFCSNQKKSTGGRACE